MGWASGSGLAESIWLDIRDYIPDAKKKEVAKQIIDYFQDHDADDWDQEDQIVIDAGYPIWEDEDDSAEE